MKKGVNLVSRLSLNSHSGQISKLSRKFHLKFNFLLRDEDDSYVVNNQNRNTQNNNERSGGYQNEDLKHLVSNAALKMNFDKKVKFADQLSFKLDNPPLF